MTPSVSDSSFVIPPRVEVIQPPPETPKLRADGGSLSQGNQFDGQVESLRVSLEAEMAYTNHLAKISNLTEIPKSTVGTQSLNQYLGQLNFK